VGTDWWLVRPCIAAGNNTQWLVPVTVSTALSPEDAVHKFVLNSDEETVTVDGVRPDDWIKVINDDDDTDRVVSC